VTVRNFSSHNASGVTKADYFYKDYENILVEILFKTRFKTNGLTYRRYSSCYLVSVPIDN